MILNFRQYFLYKYIMKIYLLRHEDRPNDCSFFTPLTKKGLENSIKLVDFLEKCNINVIFSSPFVRNLQTIYPFSKKNNIKINLEYGLSEIHLKDIIAKQSKGISLPEYYAELFNYNKEYNTIIKPNEIRYPENSFYFEKRNKKVFEYIINTYKNTDANILICAHMETCIYLLKKINPEIKYYNIGYLSKFIDNDSWNFEPINYI